MEYRLIASFIARVLLPMIAPAHHLLWIGISQAAWLTTRRRETGLASPQAMFIPAPIIFMEKLS
jgi:hypothetical protein